MSFSFYLLIQFFPYTFLMYVIKARLVLHVYRMSPPPPPFYFPQASFYILAAFFFFWEFSSRAKSLLGAILMNAYFLTLHVELCEVTSGKLFFSLWQSKRN